ncbi:MAG: hypothetical protein ACI9DC_002915 [Gammaproteobacteria bacterium]
MVAAPARLVVTEADFPFGSCLNVEMKRAVFGKQAIGQVASAGWAVDLQTRNDALRLVSTIEHQAHIVRTVVVVQVRKENVRDIDRVLAGFHQAVITARSVIDKNQIVADFNHVA